MDIRVYKYGPTPPSSPSGRVISMIIKYGPGIPFQPGSESIVIKYAPPELMRPKPRKGELPGTGPLDQEVILLSQAERSLAEVEKLLRELRRGAKPTKKLINKLRDCICELSFLYLHLEGLPQVKAKKSEEKVSGRRGRETVILYIVMAPKRHPR